MIRGVVLLATGLTVAATAHAGDADVTNVVVRQRSGHYDLDVTIRSKDAGWERYADRIEALGPDGTVLGIRVLDHPHEDEQPFTRDLYELRVPRGSLRSPSGPISSPPGLTARP